MTRAHVPRQPLRARQVQATVEAAAKAAAAVLLGLGCIAALYDRLFTSYQIH